MDLDAQYVINLVFVALGGLGRWVLNNVRQSISDLQVQDAALTEKVQRIEVIVVGEYVKREEMERMTSAIFTKLDRIEQKIDSKVDK
jgi:hypothetical protein